MYIIPLFLDANMLIEQALQIWCMSGYMADGTMPVNLGQKQNDYSKYQIVNPVQEIEVHGIASYRCVQTQNPQHKYHGSFHV